MTISSGGQSGNSASPVVEMRGIVKRFPLVLANDHVDFNIYPGEVHALLGENGAGKTTLMNILYGIYQPDEGVIRVRGVPQQIKSPRDAIRLGIGMVHQDFRLIESHTIVENVFLNHPRLGLLPDWRALEEELRAIIEGYGWSIDPKARVGALSPGEKQQVELLKLLVRGAEILLLDEPTSVLTPIESRMLFRTLRRMADEGKSIVLITHKLNEAMGISDRVTVMRRGRVVLTKLTRETNIEELSNAMIGANASMAWAQPSPGGARERELLLSVKGLRVMGDKGVLAVKGVDLDVYSGEILGIAGVSGNGQVELVETITGIRKPLSGKILFRGVDVTGAPPRRLMELGVTYIPPEGRKWGVVPELTIYENVALRVARYPPYSSRLGLIRWRNIMEMARRVVSEFKVETGSIHSRASTLSGGNVQRLILGRELETTKPVLLVAAYPTKGLDIAATEQIRRLLISLRERGIGVLLVSEDIDEVLELSDRVAVMFDGRVVGILGRDEASPEHIGAMMSRGAPLHAAT